MKALVTGGAGFIGSHLVRALLDRGVQVRVLDDFSSGKRANLEGLPVEVLEGDIKDAQAVKRGVAGVDWVFHLAAMVSVTHSMGDPVGAYQTNLIGSLQVLEASRHARVSAVVLSSSCAVYGNTSGPVSEDQRPAPLSPYAASKLAMEQAGQLYCDSYQLPVVSLRYFNVYGPRQAPDSEYAAVIPTFIQQMIAGDPVTIDGDGQQTRDFIYVQDIVEANLHAIEAGLEAAGVYNVGFEHAHSILDLAEDLQQLIPGAPEPVFGPPRQGDIRFSEADLSNISQALAFRPTIELQDGLTRTVEWFRSQPDGE